MAENTYDVTVIGACVLDVLVRPVSCEDLGVRSYPAEQVTMNIGGDAANEAMVLAALGKKVSLTTKLGKDMAGEFLLSAFQKAGIFTGGSVIEEGLDSAVNIVLVDQSAERSFITNKNGSLRRLCPADLDVRLLSESPFVSFASIFVSPMLSLTDLGRLFKALKERGCVVLADLTRPKNGETIEDMAAVLPFIDYLLPNISEARAVTGKETPCEAAKAFLEKGLGCAVIKVGKKGCYYDNGRESGYVPSFPVKSPVDTTGAGDNFAAGFIYALSERHPLYDCAAFANALASLSVEHMGASAGRISMDELMLRFISIKGDHAGE